MLPIHSNIQLKSTSYKDEESLSVEDSNSKNEPFWDPTYLLFQEFGNVEVEPEWLPTLSEVPGARKRLNRLVSNTQNEEKFHDWALSIAKSLKEKGYFLGLTYSIVGSSIPQVIGIEWLLSLTEKVRVERFIEIEKLKKHIQQLTFHRNDIDARIYVNLCKQSKLQSTKNILSLFQNIEGVKAVGIPGIGVLVTKGNWDMFIRISGRNHVFDADHAEICIPFNLKETKPTLKISHPTEFYRGLVFNRLTITNQKGLNEHAWRVQVYRSICGKWAQYANAVDNLYKIAIHLPETTINRHIKMSCKAHSMPKGSEKRHLFLLQIILDCGEKWTDAALARHKNFKDTIWSKALVIKDEKQITAVLHWIAYIAFKENWSAPFKARLSVRAGKQAFKLDTEKQTLWLEYNLPSHDLKDQNLWSVIRSIKWNSIQKNPPFKTPSKQLAKKSALMRFIDLRINYPQLNHLDWEKIVEQEDQFENEILSQLLDKKSIDDTLIKTLLPHSYGYTAEQAIKWKLEKSRESLDEDWVRSDLWKLYLTHLSTETLHKIVLRTNRYSWMELDEPLRKEILDRICFGKINFIKKVNVLKFVNGDANRWFEIIFSNLTTENFPIILSEGISKLSLQQISSRKKIHNLAIKTIERNIHVSNGSKLLDQWINLHDSRRAYELWQILRKNELLGNWNKPWELLLICGHRTEKDLSLLGSDCSKIDCPNIEAWCRVADKIVTQIKNIKIRQELLIPALTKDHPELITFYLETTPPLEQAFKLLGDEWISHYETLFPRLISQKNVRWIDEALKGWLKVSKNQKEELLEMLISTVLEWDAIEIHECLREFITHDMTYDLRLIWKVLEGAQSKKEIFIPLIHWEQWLDKIHDVPKSSKKTCINIISRCAHGHTDKLLRLLKKSEKKSKLNYSVVFREVMHKRDLNENETQVILKNSPAPWIYGLLQDIPYNKRLKGTCKLLEMLLTHDSPHFYEFKDLFMKLIDKCIAEGGLKAIHKLFESSTLHYLATPNKRIGQAVLSQIEKQTLPFIKPNSLKSEQVILMNAYLANFVMIDFFSSYRWRALDTIGLASPIQFLKSYGFLFSTPTAHKWLDKISKGQKEFSDTFIKSVLLQVSVISDYGQRDALQLNRCFAELILELSSRCDKMLCLEQSLCQWAKNTSYGIELALKTLDIQDLLEKFANFLLKVHPEPPTDESKELFKDLLIQLEHCKYKDLQELLVKITLKRLEMLEQKEYSHLFTDQKIDVKKTITNKIKPTSSIYTSAKTITSIGISALCLGMAYYPLNYFEFEKLATKSYMIMIGGAGTTLAGISLSFLEDIQKIVYKSLNKKLK